jgi:hypothetical protein
VRAVNTVTIAPLATISTSDEDATRMKPFFFHSFKVCILQGSISLPEASVKGFWSTFFILTVRRGTNRIRFV